MTEAGSTLAFKFIAVQVTIGLVVSALFALFFSAELAVAALVGSWINVIATAYFSLVALGLGKGVNSNSAVDGDDGASSELDSAELSPGAVLARFYIGEVGKFVVVAVCFTVVFRHFPGLVSGYNAVALFSAFLIAQAAYVIAPFVLKGSF